MLILLTDRYIANGVGMFGLNRLFRARRDDRGALLRAVENPLPASLGDLVGYESQKKRLKDNTLSFLRGERANNVLLYGDAGTGKSSSIQAIACEYAPMGLRLIELHRSQADLIPEIYDILRHRNYRFILFLDDLSFEENEVDYKQLKAAIEGGAEAVPENVLIYATSNRRHLIRETWNDRKDMEHQGDIHRSDTMAVSLCPLRPANLLSQSKLRGIPHHRSEAGEQGPRAFSLYRGAAPCPGIYLAGAARKPIRQNGKAVYQQSSGKMSGKRTQSVCLPLLYNHKKQLLRRNRFAEVVCLIYIRA